MTIEITNICKKFAINTSREIEALTDINLSVNDHEFVSLIGPSGCGKTTLLKIIANLVKQDSGQITFAGKQAPKAILVFQDQGLLPWLNVLENICLGLELQKVPKKEREKKALDFMNLVRIQGFEKYYPYELSGGMQQRVALARAFISNPDVLLMDEPFGALDAQTRIILQEELLNLWSRERKTVIFVTHDIDEAILLSDRIVVMTNRPGKIQKIIKIPLARPRNLKLRDDPTFTEIRWQIWNLLEQEVRQELDL
jgi:ABC-type nitrate/sulfonate/bicarbonate transport system, ATPase component